MRRHAESTADPGSRVPSSARAAWGVLALALLAGCGGPLAGTPADASASVGAAAQAAASTTDDTALSPAPSGATPSPTATDPEPLTVAEAAAYFERAGCPALQARADLFSYVGRDYGDIDLEGVTAAADQAIRRYRRAAARLAAPPRPWPDSMTETMAELRAQLLRGAQQLAPVSQAVNQVDFAEAWSRYDEVPDQLTVRSVRLLLRYSPKDTDRPGCRR